jgi:glucokinase
VNTVAVPILEVGGSHVTAAWIDVDRWQVIHSVRHPLNPAAESPELITAIAGAAAELAAPAGAHWGIAMPGPFDYPTGIGRYAGVGKFEHLRDVDVRAELTHALNHPPATITFVNDASAFLIGEWLTGAARKTRRSIALTLGTGVGSAFLADGVIVDAGPEVPPEGEFHLLYHRGLPLEDWVSQRAIRHQYAELKPGELTPDVATPDVATPDVAEITSRARNGDLIAHQVLYHAFHTLGEVLGPWATTFHAEVIAVGGAISRAFDLIEQPLRLGMNTAGASRIPVLQATDPEASALIGAAYPVSVGGSFDRTSSTSTGPSPAPRPARP